MTIIRDIVITNMLDTEIQRHLLLETLEPRQAVQTAIVLEMVERNQMRINSTTIVSINSDQNTNGFRPVNRQQQRNTIVTRRNQSNQCRSCGHAWQPNHEQNCIALGKKYNNCYMMNRFAKMKQ